MSQPSDFMLWVKAPHFTAMAIVGDSGQITEAAPILSYTIGWNAAYTYRYFRGKNYQCKWVKK